MINRKYLSNSHKACSMFFNDKGFFSNEGKFKSNRSNPDLTPVRQHKFLKILVCLSSPMSKEILKIHRWGLLTKKNLEIHA